jgi:hypothetical protein
MELSEQASTICQDIYKNSIIGRSLSLQLKNILLTEGIISDEDTFETISKNVHVKALLVRHIALGASRSSIDSHFGFNGISDFDLFHNCATDAQLHLLITQHHLSFTEVELARIKKCRHNLRRFLYRIRSNVIFHFELPETPLKNIVKTKKEIAEKLAADTSELGQKESGKRTREAMGDTDEAEEEEEGRLDKKSPREIAKDKLLFAFHVIDAQYTSLSDVSGGGLCIAVDFDSETFHVDWDGDSFENVVPFDTVLGNHFMRSNNHIALK